MKMTDRTAAELMLMAESCIPDSFDTEDPQWSLYVVSRAQVIATLAVAKALLETKTPDVQHSFLVANREAE